MSYNIYPFFIDCSEKHEQPDDRYNMLIDFAVGKRGIFLKRVNGTVLVTPKGEFQIPETYSEEKYAEFKQKCWDDDTEFSNIRDAIKDSRRAWTTTKKRDKIYLFNKLVASLDISMSLKILFSSLATFALLLKLYKPSDIIYEDFEIKYLNGDFHDKETFKNLNFIYDYSVPVNYKTISVNNTTTC